MFSKLDTSSVYQFHYPRWRGLDVRPGDLSNQCLPGSVRAESRCERWRPPAQWPEPAPWHRAAHRPRPTCRPWTGCRTARRSCSRRAGPGRRGVRTVAGEKVMIVRGVEGLWQHTWQPQSASHRERQIQIEHSLDIGYRIKDKG